ncbi:MAG: ATP synthase F0 subunit B [Candidatus Gastranaerophilales bacterium]|nr:ATP synthase F0 subunit B [Candidatus Gastranaerophilales bacterium]
MLEFNATFFVAMFSFIIFMIIMNSILYKPLVKIEEERDKLISKNYEDTKITTEKVEELKKQHELSIEKSKFLAKTNFNKKVSEYKNRRNGIIENAKNLSKKDLAISNAGLEGDEREAKLLLKSDILTLANLAASKILGYQTQIKEIDDDIVNSCMNG